MMQVKSTRYSALLVEDDPLVIGMARDAAAESGDKLGLTVLESTEAVLGWIRGDVAEKGQMPDIIIIDLKLPKLEGWAVLRTMRNHPATREIPIVVFSEEHTQADVLLSYHVGANSFVPKPADHAQFGELFRDQLGYWMRSRQGKKSAAVKGDGARQV